MPLSVAIFLTAAVVSVFAFISIVVWVTTPSRERQARDRLALLKTLAENPNENARQVLAFLREEDAKRARKAQLEELRSHFLGGLVLMAVGVGLGGMLVVVSRGNDLSLASVGLIPFLIGCVMLGASLMRGTPGGDQA